jgi:hypothetical protein
MMPTGSAVVSDLVDLCRNIRLGAARRVPLLSFQRNTCGKRTSSPFRISLARITCVSRWWTNRVLSRISGILGDLDISILS